MGHAIISVKTPLSSVNTLYLMNIEVDFSEKIVASGQAALVTKLIYLQNQFKIFHWQTFSYAQHQAFGNLYDALSESIDEFVETYQGVYGRLSFYGEIFALSDLNYSSFSAILTEQASILKTYEQYFSNTDLLNIRDEILGTLNRTAYLLTLV
jgi:DNA-binding ferritin-like protein